ncbi:MAG: tetratricopeptide repeat protein [Gemmatimonadetes bacterium]|nr:tetratricopeptide repeat protein [Gemmatimonadota bacterium]
MSPPIDAAQVRRWQEEVAKDPGSTSFLPLAEVYRREGRLEVARRLCVRGLERHPEQVDAHFLLGRIYRESGEMEKAFDELDIALSLDPEHQPSRRAIGYLSLERRDWSAAARHLQEAARHDPRDDRVASALALAHRHARSGSTAGGGTAEELLKSLDPALDHFVREARVRLLLVTEGSGKIVAQRGFSRELDIAAFATLGAGIQSASRALAGMLGQSGFEQLYQGVGEHQIFLGPLPGPTGELILLTSFGEETTIGLVRVHFADLARTVGAIEWSGGAPPTAGRFEAELNAGLDRARGADPLTPEG